MSLNFACITPHAPILIPEIGQEDLTKVTKTVDGLKKIAQSFGEAEIDTLIFISPHALVFPDRFNISTMSKNLGNLAQFGQPNIKFEFNNDLELVDQILAFAKEENIPVFPYDNNGDFFELDHGIMVPLYYLRAEQDSSLKIIPIAYSGLTRAQHFTFGQLIGAAAKAHPERVGIVASGDLSHRLISGAPQDNPNAGKNFDILLTEDLAANNVQEIMFYEEDFVENAGECGYRSIITLLGALDNIKVKPELLSYEGPFGVGYTTINYILPETD